MLAVYLSPIYIVVNIWLLFRIQSWLGACHDVFRKRWVRTAVTLVYGFLALSMLIAFFMPPGQARRILKLTGNEWLGVLLYLLMAVLLADTFRFLHFLSERRRRRERSGGAGKETPEVGSKDAGKWSGLWGSRRFHAITGGVCAAAVVVVSLWGTCNARVIHVTPYEITVNKEGGKMDSLNVVLIADLHLGYNIGTAHMSRMVEKINEQNADLVVIAGDIFDNEYQALDDPEELAAILRNIRSKYGVYACYGNHDIDEKILAGFTFGGKAKKESSPQMDEFLEKADIRLLRDEAVLIDDSVYLYGRPDAERPGRGIDTRKTAAELMEGLDAEKPVIVLDHEPKEFQELADAGADVDLCGHTHDGQMFPGNLVTALMWENSYGYLKKDNMHTIVTSGVGLFGPYMRVGTIAEICPVRIHFQ